MTDKIFFDSNIYVYALDENNPQKQAIARNLLNNAIYNKNAIISTQNLQEFYNAATKKLKLDKENTRISVELYSQSFPVIHVSLRNILKAIQIQIKNQLSFYDSLIIATASQEGCVLCYSEDLNAGQIIEGVKIINPFIAA